METKESTLDIVNCYDLTNLKLEILNDIFRNGYLESFADKCKQFNLDYDKVCHFLYSKTNIFVIRENDILYLCAKIAEMCNMHPHQYIFLIDKRFVDNVLEDIQYEKTHFYYKEETDKSIDLSELFGDEYTFYIYDVKDAIDKYVKENGEEVFFTLLQRNNIGFDFIEVVRNNPIYILNHANDDNFRIAVYMAIIRLLEEMANHNICKSINYDDYNTVLDYNNGNYHKIVASVLPDRYFSNFVFKKRFISYIKDNEVNIEKLKLDSKMKGVTIDMLKLRSSSYVSKIAMYSIADALGVNIDWLLGKTEEKNPKILSVERSVICEAIEIYRRRFIRKFLSSKYNFKEFRISIGLNYLEAVQQFNKYAPTVNLDCCALINSLDANIHFTSIYNKK